MSSLFWIQYGNSITYSLVIAFCSTIIGLFTGYAMARTKSKGMRIFFWICCILLFLPFQVTLLPSYLLLEQLHLLDTVWAIILPGFVSPLPILFMFLGNRTVPLEYEEAFRLESNSLLLYFEVILIPNMLYMILITMTIMFILTWNLVEQPLIFLKKRELWPLSLGLMEQGQGQPLQILLYMIPEVVVVIMMVIFILRYRDTKK